MRINHTAHETYKVYSYLPCNSELFNNIKRWYPFKHYSSKQSALSAIKRFKLKHEEGIEKGLIFKIVWAPYPFANDDECIIVYNEDAEEI